MRTVLPVSPGEMLDEEFLRPLGLTKYRLAKDIGVPPPKELGTSLRVSAPLRQTPICGYVGISDSVTGGGFEGRPTTTQRSLAKSWAKHSRVFLGANCCRPEKQ